MASSSGNSNSSGSIQPLQNSGSEGELQHLMDQRKRKRMESNRESARRSRMRKQQHLDDLTAQVAQLRQENNHLLTSINSFNQRYMAVEAENLVLRAQKKELRHRLQSLTDIISDLNNINKLNNNNNGFFEPPEPAQLQTGTTVSDHDHHGFMNPWNDLLYVNQPIMATADMLQY